MLWPSYSSFHMIQYYIACTTEEKMLFCSGLKSSWLLSLALSDDSKAQITGVIGPLGESSHVSLRRQHTQVSNSHKCKDVQTCSLMFTKAHKSTITQIHTYTISLQGHAFLILKLLNLQQQTVVIFIVSN